MPARQQQRLRPFEIGTDIRWEPLGSLAMTQGGSDITFTLNKTGLLAWLRLRLTGTVTSVGGSNYAALGPWNLLKRVRLITNMNNIVPIDLSGYSLYLLNCYMQRSWAPDLPTDTDLFAAALNTSGSSWVLMLDIPVSLNLGPQRRFGLINVQDPTVQVQLKITPGTNLDAITGSGISSSGLSVELLQGNWEIPDQRVYEVPVGPGKQTIHYLLEKPFPLTSTGDQILTLDRDDARLLRLFFYALVNGARDTGANWTQFRLRYNVVNIPIQLNEAMLKFDMRKESGIDWTGAGGTTAAPQRAGAYVLDRWHSSHTQGAGAFWDSIYIPNISQIDFIPTLKSGTTLASGDQIFLLRQELQRL